MNSSKHPSRSRAHDVNDTSSGATLAFSALVVGCLGDPARGYPLYTRTEELPAVADVARLSGYVQSVDGRDVSSVRPPFELLPGCHVILTPSHWGSFASDKASGITATTGAVNFVLPMKPGSSYSVKVETAEVSGPVGEISLRTYERDAKGNVTRTFPPAGGQWDPERCKPAGER
jgi:hypothetical protein